MKRKYPHSIIPEKILFKGWVNFDAIKSIGPLAKPPVPITKSGLNFSTALM